MATRKPIQTDNQASSNRIALPDKTGLIFYEASQILRCQSDNSYTDFYLLNEANKNDHITKVVISKGFDYLEEFLISKGYFYRVHNQHIININFIKQYIKNDGGYLILDYHSDTKIPVARARRAGFLKHLKNQGILL